MPNHLKENPAARASAGRGQSLHCSATNKYSLTPSKDEFQLKFLARRGVNPALAPIVAEIAFGGRPS